MRSMGSSLKSNSGWIYTIFYDPSTCPRADYEQGFVQYIIAKYDTHPKKTLTKNLWKGMFLEVTEPFYHHGRFKRDLPLKQIKKRLGLALLEWVAGGGKVGEHKARRYRFLSGRKFVDLLRFRLTYLGIEEYRMKFST